MKYNAIKKPEILDHVVDFKAFTWSRLWSNTRYDWSHTLYNYWWPLWIGRNVILEENRWLSCTTQGHWSQPYQTYQLKCGQKWIPLTYKCIYLYVVQHQGSNITPKKTWRHIDTRPYLKAGFVSLIKVSSTSKDIFVLLLLSWFFCNLQKLLREFSLNLFVKKNCSFSTIFHFPSCCLFATYG